MEVKMENLKMPPTSIPEYFSGQSILITGGTGLMGKVLLEKLLRCCPDITKIYLLMRPKKYGSVQQRWKEIMDLPLFCIVREKHADSFRKVHLVQGDIGEKNLGLAEEDEQMLLENVTIIYHAAAMIQFTDNLQELLVRNTRATYILLDLAKRMIKLQLFLYVSTAFSNMNIPCNEVEERVLPACQDWRVILKMLDKEPGALAALREKLMCGHPNAYTWSKSLSEQIVDEYRTIFPTVIMRPAIVCPSFKEPFQGWADILCGLSAVSVPIGLGLMRVVYTEYDCYQDYIPVDTAISAILVASWKKYLEPEEGKTDVYNCGVAKQLPVKTFHLHNFGKQTVKELPSKNIVWAFHAVFTTNDHLFYLLFILLQVIPGAIMDLILSLTGQKPIILNLTKKFANVFRIFKRFSSAQIEFPNDKFRQLEKYVSEEDKIFSISIEGLTEFGLMRFGLKSVLEHVFKEDISEASLEKNRRRLFWLEVMDKCIIYTFYLICCWFIYRYLASIDSIRYASYRTYKAIWI